MQIDVRPLTLDDYQELVISMQEAYPNIEDNTWSKRNIQKLTSIFPEGQICITVDGKVVAAALAIIVRYELYGNLHTYEEITGKETFSTHNKKGNVLYGIELFVNPEYRSLRLGRRLYDARKELCELLNLKSIIVGGRIPGFSSYSKELDVKSYISKVRNSEIYDAVLSFQLSNGFSPIKILTGYLPGDTESREYAVLLRWDNIYYTQKQSTVNDSVVRIGLVQWQMRKFEDIDAFYQQVEFFVKSISEYESDFCVFPEFFNTPLLAPFNHLHEREAMEELAKLTAQIIDKIAEYAVSYNVNIIAGSMPVMEGSEMYNVSYLLHRDGKRDEYRKIHITPNEQKFYGMVGGSEVKTFETDCGKIGILICYDVEFPELTRLLADQGMKILFVPYLTDTQNAYTRVRTCGAARAIENECYVAITGSVGNLPGVNNMDIQFGQATVFTPSDFAFPSNAIKGEATANTEMTLIVDVDLNLLKELHYNGSVQVLNDRRKDLYSVRLNKE